MERDELLEGAALVELGVVEAPDHDVRDMGKAVRAEQVPGSGGGERCQRILALDPALGEVVGAARRARSARRARVHEQPADMGVPAERGHELRVPGVELLERQPTLLLHQVDEAKVPGAEDDRGLAADVVLGALLLRRAPGCLAERVADHRVLLVAAGDLGDLAVRERALDQLVEPVAVPLLEGRTLGLPVVREHDDLAWSRRVRARAVDAGELLVELPEGLQGVRALEAGMMGDLVVARERRVDGGAPFIMSERTP